MLHDEFKGEDAEDVALGFAVEQQFVVRLLLLVGEPFLETVLTAVVGCGCVCPAAEANLEGFEVAAGGTRRCFEVVAHVDLVVDLETVLDACGFHELPVAAGASRGGDVLQAALDDAEIFHVLRHTLFLEDALDGGEDAGGTLDVEERAALVVHVGDQLAVEAFAHVP